jgi:hypothetical protein
MFNWGLKVFFFNFFCPNVSTNLWTSGTAFTKTTGRGVGGSLKLGASIRGKTQVDLNHRWSITDLTRTLAAIFCEKCLVEGLRQGPRCALHGEFIDDNHTTHTHTHTHTHLPKLGRRWVRAGWSKIIHLLCHFSWPLTHTLPLPLHRKKLFRLMGT